LKIKGEEEKNGPNKEIQTKYGDGRKKKRSIKKK
jgi:hypothetical protein